MGRPVNSVERMLNTSVNATPDCWVWIGPIAKNGYGKAAIRGKSLLAHRVFYEHFIGSIPEGHQIDHLCRNRACVNPNHLEAVLPAENVARSEGPAAINARRTRCIHGHELSGENLYLTPSGRRQCRTCRADASRKAYYKEPSLA